MRESVESCAITLGLPDSVDSTIGRSRVASQREELMLRNTFRGVLGLVLVAAATWLANYITERIFGPEDPAATA
jgi:hypothetical protein